MQPECLQRAKARHHVTIIWEHRFLQQNECPIQKKKKKEPNKTQAETQNPQLKRQGLHRCGTKQPHHLYSCIPGALVT